MTQQDPALVKTADEDNCLLVWCSLVRIRHFTGSTEPWILLWKSLRQGVIAFILPSRPPLPSQPTTALSLSSWHCYVECAGEPLNYSSDPSLGTAMKDIARGNNDLIGIIGLVGNSCVHIVDGRVSYNWSDQWNVKIATMFTSAEFKV